MHSLKWNDISKYRTELFGLAIISIIIFHFFEGVEAAEYTGKLIKTIAKVYNGGIGSVGVDVFVFLSGFGIYYSLSKKPSLLKFYIKRLQRVIIPYLIMGGIFWIVKDLIIKHELIGKFVYDYSLLSFWGSGVRTFWYISFICIMYLLSPLIYYFKGRKTVLTGVILSLLLCVLLYITNKEIFNNIEIAILRIPEFLIGMYCAELSEKEQVIDKRVIFALVLSVPVKIVVGITDFPFARFFNGFYALFLIVLYLIWRNRRNTNKFYDFLKIAGNLSLELYIVHVAIRNIMGVLGMKTANPLIYMCCIIISIPLAVLFSKMQKIVLK